MATKFSATIRCDHEDNTPPRGSFDSVFLVSAGYGNDKKEYRIHRGPFSHHTSKYNHAFGLPDFHMTCSEPAFFDTIVYWMYTGRFWYPGTSRDSRIPLSMDHVLRTFFFGVSHGMAFLQRDALGLLYYLTVQDWKALISAAKTIYEDEDTTPTLRHFLLDFAVNVWGFDFQSHPHTVFPMQFLKDGLERLKQLQKAPGMPEDFDTAFSDWIKKKDETFCREYHHHDHKRDAVCKNEDDAVQSERATSSHTISRSDRATSVMSEEASKNISGSTERLIVYTTEEDLRDIRELIRRLEAEEKLKSQRQKRLQN